MEYDELNIFSFFQLLREKLRATINDKFELDQNSERKSSAELQEALREALANMLIHADYADGETDIKVTVEDLYYTFTNPGKMLVTASQFFMGGVSHPRNNTLITFFRQMGISDRAGTGGSTLLNFAKLNKFRAPEIETDLKHTVLKLWIAAPLDSHPEFDDNEQRIYKYLYSSRNGGSVSELEEVTSLSRYQVRKILNQFMEQGIIIQVGQARATRYYCTPSIIERADFADKFRRSLLYQPEEK